MNRSLVGKFEPSIATTKGAYSITENMFKPTLIESKSAKKKKAKDEQSDNSDNEVQRAYKKQ